MTRVLKPWTWQDQLDRERQRAEDHSQMLTWEPSTTAFTIPCNSPGWPHAVRAYSEDRVYFTVVYDGGWDTWIGSTPRSPHSGAPIEEIGQ